MATKLKRVSFSVLPDWGQAAAGASYDTRFIVEGLPLCQGNILAAAQNWQSSVSACGDLALVTAVARLKQPKVRVLDVGGWTGGHYVSAHRLIGEAIEIDWTVLETDAVCTYAEQNIDTPHLRYARDVEELTEEKFDIVHASGSIQYLENPYAFLARDQISSAKFLVLARLPVTSGHMLYRQHVEYEDGSLSYPGHAFDHDQLISFLSRSRRILAKWETGERHQIGGKVVYYICLLAA